MARVLILGALVAAAASPASAQSRQKQRELARIQSELRRTREELESLRASAQALDQDVSRLEGLDASSRKRLERLQASIRGAEERRAGLKSRLEAASRVEGFWSEALSAETARVAAAAQARSDFFGRSELWSDEFRRAAIIEKARHLRGLKGFQRRTAAAEAVARRRAAELGESRRLAQAEREGRRKEYESKKVQLETTQSKVAEAERRAKELEENARALTALLDKLAKAGRYRRAGPAATLDRPRHSLPWPADGSVLSGFGRERDSELGTWTVRQGVTFGTAASAPVTAVAPGRVIFSGPFRSYGEVVIVDHGGGFFTVYGQLGEISKGKGSEVRAGEPIARAGVGESGGRVYLEVRRGTEALDPMTWLEKK